MIANLLFLLFKLACTVAASNDQARIPGPPKSSLAKLIGIEVSVIFQLSNK